MKCLYAVFFYFVNVISKVNVPIVGHAPIVSHSLSKLKKQAFSTYFWEVRRVSDLLRPLSLYIQNSLNQLLFTFCTGRVFFWSCHENRFFWLFLSAFVKRQVPFQCVFLWKKCLIFIRKLNFYFIYTSYFMPIMLKIHKINKMIIFRGGPLLGHYSLHCSNKWA